MYLTMNKVSFSIFVFGTCFILSKIYDAAIDIAIETTKPNHNFVEKGRTGIDHPGRKLKIRKYC